MIGGIIVGPEEKTSSAVLLRAIGPSLENFGVPNPLADPMFELRDGDGGLNVANDNWKTTQQAEIEATGLQPSNDFESALLMSLTPGSYTAIVRGTNDGTGVALVEA